MDMVGVYCIMSEGVIYDFCYIRKPTSIFQQCSQVFVDPKSWYTRCDQVAMLLINPSMRKDQSMSILIMLLHVVDHRVDIGVDAFLWKEIFVRIFLLRAILTKLGAMISFIFGSLFHQFFLYIDLIA